MASVVEERGARRADATGEDIGLSTMDAVEVIGVHAVGPAIQGPYQREVLNRKDPPSVGALEVIASEPQHSEHNALRGAPLYMDRHERAVANPHP
ncbi:hypothetical protein EIP91_011993 [Steccherinum ochraceum]|uniref:Uncharacterized protein n=1 Tax=Steccherinum ochraceum TaxID=92696 RepID=A0A4R0RHE6_9APHY|nr:hypothetical protein EIP91_011993 [Steccherinum ochraceum]